MIFKKGVRQAGGAGQRLLLVVGVIAALIAFLSIEATRYREIKRLRDETNLLQEDVRIASANAEAALSAVISPQALKKAKSSVYLIVVNGAARGTAFVVDREKGVLVTAAHTADSLPLADDTADVRIVNRFSNTALKVKTSRLHGGYGTFRALVEDYQPIRKNSSIYAPQATPLRDMAFDAGLIFVDPVNSETGENILGPNLEIAPEDSLLALEAGDPIAVIGFPYDTLDDGFSPDAAIARIERGVIAAMTPPLDNLRDPPDPEVANLIIHRLATAGGSSGSPMLNVEGKVVGIHTHGIESVSSNADGAAQRAEVIYDLLDPEREARRVDEIFLPAWKRLLSYWARAEDALPWSFFMEYARPGEEPPPLVGEFENSAGAPYVKNIERIAFEPKSESRRVDAGDVAQEKIGAGDKDTTLLRDGPSFLLGEKGEYSEIWRTVDRSRENVLFAFDYSLRSKQGFCPLASYWRKKGETKLRVMPLRASFELHLPATGNFSEEYQIILRRFAGCDPISAEYFFGVISWPPDSEPDAIAVAYSQSPDRTNDAEPFENTRFDSVRQALSKFFICDVRRRSEDALCQEAVYIDLDRRAAPKAMAD